MPNYIDAQRLIDELDHQINECIPWLADEHAGTFACKQAMARLDALKAVAEAVKRAARIESDQPKPDELSTKPL